MVFKLKNNFFKKIEEVGIYLFLLINRKWFVFFYRLGVELYLLFRE